MKIDAMDYTADLDDPIAPILPDEVSQANLYDYAPAQLEGRQAYYEREALFERDPTIRAALKDEADRTTIELNRRKMYERAEAERVFSL